MTVERVGIVGAGIVGLAYALSAVERGHSVTLFERDASARGASVRNFGMVWPIGQALSSASPTALASRRRWERTAAEVGLWFRPCGSLHVAHAEDEWQVLREFHDLARATGIDCRLLGPGEVEALSPIANPAGLRGGLSSPTEAGVNPRRAVAAIAAHLSARHAVDLRFGTTVTAATTGRLVTADGRTHSFDRVILCGGTEVETVFPGFLTLHGIRRCKLQMLATPPRTRPGGIGPFLAGGLTLRHYANFARCPSLEAVRARIARESPELDRFGVHVMIAANEDGSLILGDSHEYDDVGPFDKEEIDELILRELRRIARLPSWTIAERWHGFYAKHGTLPIVRAEPERGVFVRTGTGGAGMTMAFGCADEDWTVWQEREPGT